MSDWGRSSKKRWPRFSRRLVLGLGSGALLIVGVVLLAAGARSVFLWLDDGDDGGLPGDGSVGDQPSKTPSAPATATPTKSPPAVIPTISPPSFQTALQEAPDALVRHDFSSGTTIQSFPGVYLLEPETGAIEAWRLPGDADGGFAVSDDNRFITVNPNVGGQLIHDRAADRTYEIVDQRVVATRSSGGGKLVLAMRLGQEDSDAQFLAIADFDSRSLTDTRVELAGRGVRPAIVSPDGMAIAQVTADGVYLINGIAGETRRLEDVTGSRPRITDLPGDLGFAVESDEGRTRYTWDGTSHGPLAAGAVSPDGELVADWTTLFPSRLTGLGGMPSLRIVTVSGGTSDPHFRILGAVLPASPLYRDARWLADSAALVVETVDGFQLVSTMGEFLGPAPMGVPSPDDAELFSSGIWGVTNLQGTVEHSITIDYQSAIDLSVRPWGDSSDYLRFGFIGGGKDFSYEVPLLKPVVQFPPFDEPSLVVATIGDCLNIRDDPSIAGAVLACVPSGTRAAVSSAKVASGRDPGTYAVYAQSYEEVWVHLEISDDVSGWGNARFLEWAP